MIDFFYTIDGHNLTVEKWGKVLVLFNGNVVDDADFILPEGTWEEILFGMAFRRRAKNIPVL